MVQKIDRVMAWTAVALFELPTRLLGLLRPATYVQSLQILIAGFRRMVDQGTAPFRMIGAHYVKIALHKKPDGSGHCLSYTTRYDGTLDDYLARAERGFGDLLNLVWSHCEGFGGNVFDGNIAGRLHPRFEQLLTENKIDSGGKVKLSEYG